MKLPRRPGPFDDELLTSWLVRTAAANGLKVHTLCARILPREAVWNRDFDRIALEKHLDALADATGYEACQLRALTLRRYVNILYCDYPNTAAVPWILPVGIYHRVRLSFGLMCCPRCVMEEPYYRVMWRLGWMTVCPEHGMRLIDRCGRCKAPILFHRNELGRPAEYEAQFETRCWSCGHALIADLKYYESDGELLAVQGLMASWMKVEHGRDSGISAMQRFYVARAICGALIADRGRHAKVQSQYLRFEMLSVKQRAKVLIKALPYLSDLSTALRDLYCKAGLRPSDIRWRSREARDAFNRLKV